MIFLKSHDEIEVMRQAGKIVAEVIETVVGKLKEGISTAQLDQIAETLIRQRGAIPTFIGYQGYKKSLCTSVNQEVVHGIPGEKILHNGDIIGIDCGVTWRGFVADSARTVVVGSSTDRSVLDLLEHTERSLFEGVKNFQEGNRIGDIGFAIEAVAKQYSYGVVKDFVGHGIGRKMHEEPQVPNFGKPATGPRIKRGMVLAIEPMFNLGTGDVKVLQDGWTVVTKDGKWSAHFEHTVALTDNGPEVLTK